MVRRLILVVVLLTSLRGVGQSLITIDTSIFTYTDTINFQNLNFMANVLIRNTGTVVINDTVDLHIAVDTGSGGLNFFAIDTSVLFLNPGDTAFWNLGSITPTLAFKSGINTVVIWPKAHSPVTSTEDSLFLTVFVDTTGLSAHFNFKPKGFLMYPNPGKELLHFKSFEVHGYYKKVVLYDAEGRSALETDFGDQIDISFLRNGVYIVSVETNQGEMVRFRFVKE